MAKNDGEQLLHKTPQPDSTSDSYSGGEHETVNLKRKDSKGIHLDQHFAACPSHVHQKLAEHSGGANVKHAAGYGKKDHEDTDGGEVDEEAVENRDHVCAAGGSFQAI